MIDVEKFLVQQNKNVRSRSRRAAARGPSRRNRAMRSLRVSPGGWFFIIYEWNWNMNTEIIKTFAEFKNNSVTAVVDGVSLSRVICKAASLVQID